MQQDETRGKYPFYFPTMAAKGATDLVSFVYRLESLKEDALACINIIISESVMPWLMHEEGIAEGDDLAENGKTEDFDVIREMIRPGMSVEQFLDDIEELSKAYSADESGSVVLGTVHAVKGCERNKVILNITRMPIIPPKRKEGALPVGIPNTIEDERNIAYVGITRAKRTAIVVQAHEWMGIRIETSQFINELGIVFDEHKEEYDRIRIDMKDEDLDTDSYGLDEYDDMENCDE
jgi:superfamily I DNA/RNA helicase